jgi:hypothetical protein
MHKYRVIEHHVAARQLALKCAFGRYHRARVLGGCPDRDAVLQGTLPHLGFAILLCMQSGEVFRVIFETINATAPDPDLVCVSAPVSAVAHGDGRRGKKRARVAAASAPADTATLSA